MTAPATRFRASSLVARKACPVSSSLRRAGNLFPSLAPALVKGFAAQCVARGLLSQGEKGRDRASRPPLSGLRQRDAAQNAEISDANDRSVYVVAYAAADISPCAVAMPAALDAGLAWPSNCPSGAETASCGDWYGAATDTAVNQGRGTASPRLVPLSGDDRARCDSFADLTKQHHTCHRPNAATININTPTARGMIQGRLNGLPRRRAGTCHSPQPIAAFNPSGNGAGYSARMVRAPVTSAGARDWWAFDDLPRIAKDMTTAGRLFLPKHKLAGASVPAIFRSAA